MCFAVINFGPRTAVYIRKMTQEYCAVFPFMLKVNGLLDGSRDYVNSDDGL